MKDELLLNLGFIWNLLLSCALKRHIMFHLSDVGTHHKLHGASLTVWQIGKVTTAST